MSRAFDLFWLMGKIQRLLFGVCWRIFILVYFGVGLGSLTALFFIEAQFFSQVTRSAPVGFGIAAIFEIAKIGASVIKQAISIANRVTRVKVSAVLQGLTVVFQAVLVVVSLTCAMVVLTAYLQGRAPEMERLLTGRADLGHEDAGQHELITSTLTILKNGVHLNIKPDTFISLFAIVLSGLFQATSFIVFGHLLAMHARDLEHLFEAKLYQADAKKNFGLNT